MNHARGAHHEHDRAARSVAISLALLVIAALAVMLGALPVLIWPNLAAAFVSAVIFGGSFMAGPSSVTALVRKLSVPHLATAAIAALLFRTLHILFNGRLLSPR
ncbi:MAG TPA: hypothetical protein VGM81_10015 [Burkholderiaceae bacterium]|jgi:hypothetical protein